MNKSGEGAGNDRGAVWEACIAAAGMCLFALFAHGGFPQTLFSACGLLLTTIAVSRGVGAESSPASLFGVRHFSLAIGLFTLFGVIAGGVLGFIYQWVYGLPIHVPALGRFAPVSALIGGSEEALYRGYMQGRLRGLGPTVSVVFASLAHTAYKLFLFILPSGTVRTDFTTLAICTFVVGLGAGFLRRWTGSIFPSVACHACFDIIVYGAYPRAPWWVW